MTIGDVYRLTLHQAQFLSRYQNTVHLQMKTTPDPTTALFQTVADNFKAQFRAFQNQSLQYLEWDVQQVRGALVSYTQPKCEPVGGLQFNGNFTAPTTGALVGEALPPQIAQVTTLLTGIAGRSRRGRMYLAAFEETQQVNGVIVSGTLTAITTAFDALRALYGSTGTDANFTWVIWSHLIATGCKPNPNPPPAHLIVSTPNPADAARPVVQQAANSTLFTQRRRVPGFGT